MVSRRLAQVPNDYEFVQNFKYFFKFKNKNWGAYQFEDNRVKSSKLKTFAIRNDRIFRGSKKKLQIVIPALDVYYIKVSTKESLSSSKKKIDSLFVLTFK